ncbi:hypothetical protein AL542_18490 [Grimontia hollisae]|nr:hypothetical protein AL542_18490 [Grimontia hollisae]
MTLLWHHPKSCSTQHPAPSTQHPAPSTQHPAPSTQHPAPSTQHPAPSTQHPVPGSSNPKKTASQRTPFIHSEDSYFFIASFALSRIFARIPFSTRGLAATILPD